MTKCVERTALQAVSVAGMVICLLVPNLLILTGERTARQREQAAPAQPSRYIRQRPAQW